MRPCMMVGPGVLCEQGPQNGRDLQNGYMAIRASGRNSALQVRL